LREAILGLGGPAAARSAAPDRTALPLTPFPQLMPRPWQEGDDSLEVGVGGPDLSVLRCQLAEQLLARGAHLLQSTAQLAVPPQKIGNLGLEAQDLDRLSTGQTGGDGSRLKTRCARNRDLEQLPADRVRGMGGPR
jgi:hypothetical protein